MGVSGDNSILLDLSGIKAVIFDMDGTMISNMKYHKEAWMEFAKEHGVNMSENEFQEKFSGRKNKQILEMLLGKPLSETEVAEYTEEKEALYRALYAPDIHEVVGLTPFIKELEKRGLMCAIATTAPEKNRRFVLERLKLSKYFPIILGDEHVTNGKPNPEIYLKTAEELHVDPKNCLVFEDTPVGIEAAKNADMEAIGVLTRHTKEELKRADFLIRDFTELSIQ